MLKALTELCMQKSVPNFTVGPGFVQLLVWVFFPKSIILGSLDFYECIQLLFLAQSPSFQGKWSHFIKAELLPSPKQNSPFLTPEIPCAPFSILKKKQEAKLSRCQFESICESFDTALRMFGTSSDVCCGVGRGLGPLQSHVVLGLSLAEKLREKKCHCDCVVCKMCKCKISICRWLQVPHQRGDCHYQWGMGSAWQTWVQCKSPLLLHGYPASSAGMLEDGWHLAYSLQIAGQ